MPAGSPPSQAASLEALERAAAERLGEPLAHAEAGVANLQASRYARAAAHLRVAVAAAPEYAEAWSNLAFAHLALEQVAEGHAAADRAIALRPGLAAAWNLRGLARERRGDAAAARADYEKALSLDPALANAHVNLGNVAQTEGRFDAARASYETAATLDPAVAEAHYNLAYLLHQTGDVEASLPAYERAIAARPGYALAHHNRAHALCLLGRFAEAWRESAWRPPRIAHAEKLARTGLAYSLPEAPAHIAILSEQGLGDILFFLRFVPALRERGYRFDFVGSPRLAPMLARTGLFESLRTEAEGPVADRIAVLAGDLPALADAGTPPPLALTADAARVAALRERLAALGPPPYIALTWRAGIPRSGAFSTLFKDVPVDAFGAALRGLEATFLSVQREPDARDAAALAEALGRPLHDFSAANEDLDDALAVMAAIDTSVGVSNTLVHLRAGLGGDAQVLVPFPPEWRWMHAGPSPWFPRFDVHRQDASRRWDGALAQLAAALSRKFSSARTGSDRPNSSP